MIVPVRSGTPGFGATLNVMSDAPEPLGADVTVIHEFAAVAVHAQVAEAPSVKLPLPPAAVTLPADGVSV